MLHVSIRTLSLWENDLVYPVWAYQPRLIDYLGHNPFTNPALGRPKGNESKGVAFLVPTDPLSFGQKIRNRRLELRKNQKECAEEIGVSVKTLRSCETDQRMPTTSVRARILSVLGSAPATVSQQRPPCPKQQITPRDPSRRRTKLARSTVALS